MINAYDNDSNLDDNGEDYNNVDDAGIHDMGMVVYSADDR
jgi:hypothetical protein